MKLKDCENCKFVKKLIAIGAGVRCANPDHAKNSIALTPIGWINKCSLSGK